MTENWYDIKPEVNEFSEFLEIASDFGDPLEVIREAISNSFDAGATFIKIGFAVPVINGYTKLVIELEDDGCGMSRDVLEKNFWALGKLSIKKRQK